jgi:large subunit ribosomal protein L4
MTKPRTKKDADAKPAQAVAYSAKGDESGSLELPSSIFGKTPRPHAVWEAVVNYEANQRQGTVKTKTRGEIRRSNSKPWRQKGTGRARAGTWRSPIWVGGGTIHGPQPRDHSYKMPRKLKRTALLSALSDRAQSGRVAVIDSIDLPEAKTKSMASLIKKLGLEEQKVLLLTEGHDNNVVLASRNLAKVVAMPAREVNPYMVVACDWILATKGAVKTLEEVFS